MDGTNLVYILLLTVIPVVLALFIALPFLADRASGRSQPGRQSEHPTAREDGSAYALEQPDPSSRRHERVVPGPADRAA